MSALLRKLALLGATFVFATGSAAMVSACGAQPAPVEQDDDGGEGNEQDDDD